MGCLAIDVHAHYGVYDRVDDNDAFRNRLSDRAVCHCVCLLEYAPAMRLVSPRRVSGTSMQETTFGHDKDIHWKHEDGVTTLRVPDPLSHRPAWTFKIPL